ncbi:carboxypeptidase family protein [Ulvibacter sp. MAR_2010_11]|uniref:carboxypeptidase-like regulatory domain-containing protein n=1 Tax=Ulvibacter sp. MAR_2010_11 TaxID=1250229 RepID=UPI000C2B9DDC|nr:carboxypeptidase-like regulatory domain-containing protein [Ulvibacter sp. MAR_2010_11]PKA82214.1 carboxypeptidase family protein [Ulvibacter sp. MAR_2010_11]
MMKGSRTYVKLVGVLLILLFSCNEDRIGENEYGIIKGTVVAVGSNTPLENVKISTQPASSTVFTDSAGKFRIENVPVGEYAVEARVDGYLADYEATTVVGNAEVTVVFELEISTANNRPPTAPVLTAPSENEVLQSIEAVFEWTSTDPEEDPITFTLELRNDQNEDVLLFEDITEPTFTYSPLLLGAKYFWQVSATDDINPAVLSPVGTFEVISAPVDNRFLFVRNIDGNNVIFSADENGDEFQLTSQNQNSYRPRRNVAANRIAYFQADGANIDIYTMKRDGSDKVRVTSTVKPQGFNLNEINFSWPAGSDKIYFPRFDRLYSINVNGLGLHQEYRTPDGSFISDVDVSENDDLIALKTNNPNGYDITIYTINFAGVVQDTILTGVPGAAGGLTLSVTNQKLVYSYDVSGFEGITYRRLDSRLFVYDFVTAISTDVSQEKPNGTNDLEPIFSPNEAFIIFTNTSNDGISQKNVFRLEIDTMEDDSREMLYENAFMPDWE